MSEKKDLQEFKSEHVFFTMERKPDCVVEYQVKVDKSVVQKSRKDAIRSIAKEVSLPGFRKGKAPDQLIVKKFGDLLEERWQKAIADHAFRDCQNLSKVAIVNQESRISFNVDKHSLDEGAEMSFTFESEPVVPTIDAEKIELEKVESETIDKKKVDETIEQIQMFFAEWEKVSDRAAKKGDYVVVDVDVIEEEPPKKALSNARFEVSDEKMAKWMKDLVIGLKIGEAKEGISTPDADTPEEEKKANPPKKVRLTLKSIELPKLPAIDDDLAIKLGVKTASEMRENLEKLLIKQAEEHTQKAYRDQVNEFLLENYTFDLPKSLLQKETQYRLKQLVTDPTYQQKLMAMPEEERKAAIADVEKQGERAVRLFYLSRQVIQDQNIKVAPNEVHQEVKTPLEALFSENTDNYGAGEQSQEQKAIAMSRLILTKAEDWLIEGAKIVPAKPKPKKTTAPKKETKSAAKKKTAPKKSAPEKKTTTSKKKAAKS